MNRSAPLAWLIALVISAHFSGCGATTMGSRTGDGRKDSDGMEAGEFVVYQLQYARAQELLKPAPERQADLRLYKLRIPASGETARRYEPVELNTALDARIPRGVGIGHVNPQVSRNGKFFTVTGRDNHLWIGPGVDAASIARMEIVPTGDKPQMGPAAVSNDGTLIVYGSIGCDSAGLHKSDLYRLVFRDGRWSDPVCISAASTEIYNGMPTLSHNQSSQPIKTLFNCGNNRDWSADNDDPNSTHRAPCRANASSLCGKPAAKKRFHAPKTGRPPSTDPTSLR
jgi:hypothetical protein